MLFHSRNLGGNKHADFGAQLQTSKRKFFGELNSVYFHSMEWSSSVHRALDWGSKAIVRDSRDSLCYVLEQDTFFSCLVLVQPRKARNGPDMTEKLLTGM